MKNFKSKNLFAEKLIGKTIKHLIIVALAVPFLTYFFMFMFHNFFDYNYEYISAETSIKIQLIAGAVLATAISIYINILSFYNGSEYANIGGKWTDRIINRKPKKRIVIELFLSIFLILGVVGLYFIWGDLSQFQAASEIAVSKKQAMPVELIIAVTVQAICIYLIFRWFNLHNYVKGCACDKCKAAFAYTTYKYGNIEETKSFEAKLLKESRAVGTINRGDDVIRTVYDKVPVGIQTRTTTQTSQRVECQCGYCGNLATKFNVSTIQTDWKKHKM